MNIIIKHLFFWLLVLVIFPLQGQVSNPRADSSLEAFNNAFLTVKNGVSYYKRSLVNDADDGTWTLALDIQGMLDAYERTDKPEHKVLASDLCSGFLSINHDYPYTWDGWNDDLAWMALVMARGYQMTGNEQLLTAAETTFKYCFDRGWNTEFNQGGIWEQQPDYVDSDAGTNKEALSNNPNGQLACMLYQSTGDEYYLEKAKQIYAWSRSYLFNALNGQVYTGVYRNGYINKSTAVYNQGTFIDFATLLYKLTGDELILKDARLAADFVIKNMTNNGIISNGADYLNTWAGEYARGLGHLCMENPQFWKIYYPFLKQNAEAAWSNRRTDLNLTWNAWDQPTSRDPEGIPTKYVSAVALYQFTPTLHILADTIEGEDYNYKKGGSVTDIDGGGKCVGLINTGDWLEYLIDVPATAVYTVSLKVSGTSIGSMELKQNNITLDTIELPNTGSLTTYSTISAAFELEAGIQSIKFQSLSGAWTIDKWSAVSCDLIEPSVSVNGGAAQQITDLTVNVGDNLDFNPKPENGKWSWTGSNGFIADTRQIAINSIQYNQGGVYTATYQSPEGCISVQDYMVSLNGCTPTEIDIEVLVNTGDWQTADTVIEAGSLVSVVPGPQEGIWDWTGPDGFSSDKRSISFLSISHKQEGDYNVNYTNQYGCKSSGAVTLNITGEDPCASAIIPYINLNGWKNIAYASVESGGSIGFGPHPLDENNWRWTGPNGFSSDRREFTINNFDETKAGYYTATYTNSDGCISSKDFIIGLSGCVNPSIVPEITVDSNSWQNTGAISLTSGGNITITPPELEGIWMWKGSNGGTENWMGANSFSSESRQISLNNVLSIHNGTYTVTYVSKNACISTHAIDVKVTGNDYCGTAITPYIRVNYGAWEKKNSANLEIGDEFTVGPHPMNHERWNWTGPNGFTEKKREFTVNDIQLSQAGIYKAICTNNLGCQSFEEYTVAVNVPPVSSNFLLEENATITCYPNPASDFITATNIPSTAKAGLYDISGQLLMKTQPTGNKHDVTFYLIGLKPGVYYIKIQGADERVIKFIKL